MGLAGSLLCCCWPINVWGSYRVTRAELADQPKGTPRRPSSAVLGGLAASLVAGLLWASLGTAVFLATNDATTLHETPGYDELLRELERHDLQHQARAIFAITYAWMGGTAALLFGLMGSLVAAITVKEDGTVPVEIPS